MRRSGSRSIGRRLDHVIPEGDLDALAVIAYAVVFDALSAPVQDRLDRAVPAVQKTLPPGDVMGQFAVLIEVNERARVAVTQRSRWRTRHDIQMIDDAERVRSEGEIKVAGKRVVTRSRLAEGVQPGHRAILLAPPRDGQRCQARSQAVTCDPEFPGLFRL